MATTITRAQIRSGAAKDAGLLIHVTGILAANIDANNKTVDVADLAVVFPDPQHLRDAFISEDGDDYARIVKFYAEDAPNRLLLSHIPTGLDGAAGGTEADIYTLLSPEEWNNCINEALEELFEVVRIDMALVSDQTDYSVDDLVDSEGDLCTYLQSRAQLYKVEFRGSNGLTTSIEQLGGVAFHENANSLSVHLTMGPAFEDQTSSLVLVARKPYVWRDRLMNQDSDQTNCPYRLAVTATQVKAYRLLFKKHGETMKRQFAAAMVVSEKEYNRMLADMVPAIRPTPLTLDESFYQDVPAGMVHWSW